MIVGALNMLGLVDQDGYTPQTAEQFDTTPSGGDESSSDRGREDCRRGGPGWSEYGTPDAANGNRATTMNACLDSAWLAMNPGTEVTAAVRPPGCTWATRYAGHLGLNPRNDINKLRSVFSGELEACPFSDAILWGTGAQKFVHWQEERRLLESGVDPWTGEPDTLAGVGFD
ncbi:hypothetical protein ACIQRK_03665 [Streptomyces anulatus]